MCDLSPYCGLSRPGRKGRYEDQPMNHADKTILVSGATGRQGGALLKYLLKGQWRVRALTRNPGGRAAAELAKTGVELAQGDMDDLESLKRAMKGVYGVYSVQDFWTVGARREVQQGKNMAEAARSAGVQHFLYSSVGGAERNSRISHWETKWEVENHIRKLGLPATMLRPAAFMENYYIAAVELALDHPYRGFVTVFTSCSLAFFTPRSASSKASSPTRFGLISPTKPSRWTTSAPSVRSPLKGQETLSDWSWRLPEAS